MLALILALAGAATEFGAMRITLSDVRRSPRRHSMHRQIWCSIRLQQVALALLLGTSLALSGAVMQGLFRNPLADPGLLGISSVSATDVFSWLGNDQQLPTVIMGQGILNQAQWPPPHR